MIPDDAGGPAFLLHRAVGDPADVTAYLRAAGLSDIALTPNLFVAETNVAIGGAP